MRWCVTALLRPCHHLLFVIERGRMLARICTEELLIAWTSVYIGSSMYIHFTDSSDTKLPFMNKLSISACVITQGQTVTKSDICLDKSKYRYISVCVLSVSRYIINLQTSPDLSPDASRSIEVSLLKTRRDRLKQNRSHQRTYQVLTVSVHSSHVRRFNLHYWKTQHHRKPFPEVTEQQLRCELSS